jgi:hypothetical protein
MSFMPQSPWYLQREYLFCLSHCKTCWIMIVDNVGLLGDLKFHIHSYISLLDVNQGGPMMGSVANHIFLRSKGWLQGPWCPLNLKLISCYIKIVNRTRVTKFKVTITHLMRWLQRSAISTSWRFQATSWTFQPIWSKFSTNFMKTSKHVKSVF